jgi:autotransporter-associated beta strand protein
MNVTKRGRGLRLAAAVAPVLAAASSSALGAVRTWDGGGTTDNFTDALNWVGDVAPPFTATAAGTGDDLVFLGTSRLTPFNDTINGNQTAFTITFDPTAGPFTIGGNLIVLGSTTSSTNNGNIINNSTNTATFAAEVRQRTGQINAAAGDIVFNGVFGVGNTGTVNQRASTFTGNFNTYLNGKVTLAGRLTRSGTGTTFITNDTNDYLGETVIGERGVIRISVPNALGATSQRTLIQGNTGGGGRLELAGGVTFAAEPVTIEARQAATAELPHIVNVSGNNTWTGPITLAAGGFEYGIQSAADKLTISGNISSNLTGVRNLHLGGAAEGEVTGTIGTGMSVIKDGAGTWTLSGANNYSGTITVNAGLLVINGSQTTASPAVINNGGRLKLTTGGTITGVPSVIVNAGGTFDVSGYAASGGYALPVSSAIRGSGTVQGPVNVQFATISPGVGSTPGTLTINGNVAFNGGGNATLTFAPGASSLINVNGDLSTSTANGVNNVNVLGSGLAVGTYDLIKYTGALGGEGFGGFTLGTTPPRLTAELVNDAAGRSIDLHVIAVDTPRWMGDKSSDWDINTTANWRLVSTGAETTYLQPGEIGDSVLFDDQAVNPVVNLVTVVSPAAINFNNATANYVLMGTGAISGPATLTKDGTGKVVIANFADNTFTGGTVIKNGTIQIGDDATGLGGSLGTGKVTIDPQGTLVVNRADNYTFGNQLAGTGDFVKRGIGITTLSNTDSLGFGGDFVVADGVLKIGTRLAAGDNVAAIIVQPGATLDINGQQMFPKPIRIAGAGYNGQGAIISSGGQQNALENVTLTGDATVGGPQRFDIRNLGNPTTLSTGGQPYSLTKIGPAQFGLVGVTVDPALGDVNVNEGILSIEVNTTGLGDPNKTINLAAPGQLLFWRQEIPIDKKLVSAGGGTIRSGNGTQSTFVGPVTLNADTNFQTDNGTALTLTNVIGGAGGLIKSTQTGSLVLGAVNTYSGRTQIGGGTIAVVSLANGGQPSGIGQSSADAANLFLGGGGTLRYAGSNSATTDRLFTVGDGGAGLDSSGPAGAPVVFGNTGAAVMQNTATSVTNLTLTGSNKDDNVLAASISDGLNGTSSPVGIVKSGPGTWVLSGNNTFSGVVSNSNGGILKIRSNTALGDTTGDTLVADNTDNPNPTSLWLDSPTGLTIAENFRTTGGGGGGANGGQNDNGPGVIRSVRGNNVLLGTLTSQAGGGTSTYTVDAGSTLDLAGTVQNLAGTSRILNLGGAGEGRISGVIQDQPGTNNATFGIFKNGTGPWTISGTNNTYTGSTMVGIGVLRVTGSISTSSGVQVNPGGTFEAAVTQTLNALNVMGGGTAVVSRVPGATEPTVLTTKALTVNMFTNVDVGNNAMVVDYAPGSSVLAAVRSMVRTGYGGQLAPWQGPGIISSAARANPNGAVGYGESADVLGPAGGNFLGTNVDGDVVLVRYTLAGDANLDAAVNFTDLVALAQNYNIADGARLWTQGDFTYDGDVDFEDLVKLAQNYNTSLPSAAQLAAIGAPASFGEDLAAAFAQVPEPGSISLLALGAGGMVGRRRRRR